MTKWVLPGDNGIEEYDDSTAKGRAGLALYLHGHDDDATTAAVVASKDRVVSYDNFITEAADLVSEDGENPEYDRALYELGARLFGVTNMPTDDRALYELGARLFGVTNMPTDDRASWIEADVRARRGIIPE